MSSGVQCAVVVCYNGVARLRRWQKKICQVHNCYQGMGWYICTPPFTLFPFPTAFLLACGGIESVAWHLKTIGRRSFGPNKTGPHNLHAYTCIHHRIQLAVGDMTISGSKPIISLIHPTPPDKNNCPFVIVLHRQERKIRWAEFLPVDERRPKTVYSNVTVYENVH